MDLQPAQQTFVAESRELLAAMEQALLRLERTPADADALHEVFRAAHTIKGSSGIFGFDALVDFTHAMENVLADVRAGDLLLDGPLVALLLACRDHCTALVDRICTGESAPDAALEDAGRALRQRLEAQGGAQAPSPALPLAEGDKWHVSLRFGKDVLRNGMDPLSFLRYLGTLGRIESVATRFDAMPGAAEMDPEACYIATEVDFSGAADQETIEKVFEFVQDDCTMRVTRRAEQAHGPAPLPVSANLHKQPVAREHPAPEGSFVRVRAEKLDELITLVGELVIAGATTRLLAQRAGNSELIESTTSAEELLEQVRDKALKLRMVSIGETFARFNRVVRDLGRELGKDVELVVSGAETELDKSMTEKIVDPLMHLVRNALDHGIEAPELRASRGKPATARVHLNAYHDSGSIVIEAADDGAGLDRGKILARAIERGLAAADDELSDRDICKLIMEPGFTTAEAVTNVSGRGIGMDVVRRNVEELGGSIAIDSVAGQGTTVMIRLPLTLAIIDGFLVGVGRATYVIPLDMVIECMELRPEERAAIGSRGYINLRDEILPLLRLRDVFGIPGEAGRRENIVVVHYAGRRAGFVVDALQGEFQTVIKPLGKLFERLAGISGSTILGTGEVALILDVPALIRRAIEAEGRAHAKAAIASAAAKA